MLFYIIILLGIIGLCMGAFTAFQDNMFFPGIALIVIGAGLSLLGFAVKKRLIIVSVHPEMALLPNLCAFPVEFRLANPYGDSTGRAYPSGVRLRCKGTAHCAPTCQYIPVVKIFVFLDLEQNCSFSDGHYLNNSLTNYGF
jgi:hypothetical protein